MLLRCACSLNVTTMFLRKSSNSIFNEAPVCRGILCSEWILQLPCQDGKITTNVLYSEHSFLLRLQTWHLNPHLYLQDWLILFQCWEISHRTQDPRNPFVNFPQTCTCLNKSKGISTIVILIILEFPAGIQPYLKNEVRKCYPRAGRKITAAVVLLTAHIAV